MKKITALLLVLTFTLFLTTCGEKSKEEMTVGEIIKTIEKHETPPDAGKLAYVVENYSLKDYLEKYEEVYGENPVSVILRHYGLGELHEYSMEDGNGGILEYYSLEELSEEKYAMTLLGYIQENYDVEEVLERYLDNDPECLDGCWPVLNMGKLCSEIEGQKCFEEFGRLINLCDELGIKTSNVLGKYFAEKETKIVHRTDGECIYKVPYEKLSFEINDLVFDKSEETNRYFPCKVCFE